MSPTLPQPAPLQVQTLEAGKGLARLAQAEQPLDRGSVLSRLGQVCSSAGVEAHSVLSNTGLQGPAGSLTHLSRVLGKLQYFGHLVCRTDSLEKTLMLGGIGGRTRRGGQKMRWLDGHQLNGHECVGSLAQPQRRGTSP